MQVPSPDRAGERVPAESPSPPCVHPSDVFILQDGGTDAKVLLRCHHFIYFSRFMLIIR